MIEKLTEAEEKIILEIYPNAKLKSTDEVKDSPDTGSKQAEVDKRTPEQKQDWKDGYTDYEKKTKESERITFEENEIEITEEEVGST